MAIWRYGLIGIITAMYLAAQMAMAEPLSYTAAQQVDAHASDEYQGADTARQLNLAEKPTDNLILEQILRAYILSGNYEAAVRTGLFYFDPQFINRPNWLLIVQAVRLCRSFLREHLAGSDVSLTILVAGTVREAVQIAAEEGHIVAAALDLELPDMNGLDGLSQMKGQLGTDLPVALIGPKCTTTQLRHYLDQGAAGYLPYSLAPDALLAALRVIATGEPYAPVDMMAKDDVPDQKRNGWLTGRERDVLNGLLAGQSNKEIAREHGLSEVTIKHHLKSLRSKLRARNRTHAVCRAIELGIAEEGQVAL